MSEERLHHISKKRRFTLLLIPDDDAGTTRRFRFAPWQIASLFTIFVLLVAALVILVLMYTPVGILIPIPNAELEQRYGKELLALQQRMAMMGEQLVELRTYNLKLRKALGEKVAPDSGMRQPSEKTLAEKDQPSRRKLQFDEPLLKDVQRPVAIPPTSNEVSNISFPAILPTEGYVTRGFSPDERHYGIDIAGKVGSPVVASAEGHVVFAGWTSDDGNVIILAHSMGFVSFYKHNQSLLRTAGEFVKRGEVIALLGNSGRTSMGPHVHFEIWKDGVAHDPTKYLLNMNF
jgi:murein DD-endopeptidase MepM/ murein hydrolase activator NlpD